MLIMTGPSDWLVRYTGECKKLATRAMCSSYSSQMYAVQHMAAFKETRLAVCNPHTIE